ncbi:hypothetical protein RF11_14389 [Thelohanellus kitauei]|uniref:Integrase catalytic domain-containing protein n=1 Tax=Thelohanellus kitauei TaxID=669202 RepID=A0A0C2MEA9_THEKT|nr:hypothetical protein RF11_14389 [Thelohanellus kitauei]
MFRAIRDAFDASQYKAEIREGLSSNGPLDSTKTIGCFDGLKEQQLDSIVVSVFINSLSSSLYTLVSENKPLKALKRQLTLPKWTCMLIEEPIYHFWIIDYSHVGLNNKFWRTLSDQQKAAQLILALSADIWPNLETINDVNSLSNFEICPSRDPLKLLNKLSIKQGESVSSFAFRAMSTIFKTMLTIEFRLDLNKNSRCENVYVTNAEEGIQLSNVEAQQYHIQKHTHPAIRTVTSPVCNNEGLEVQELVDTGAEKSKISNNKVQMFNLLISLLGETTPFVGDAKIPWRFLLVEGLAIDAILGIDSLNASKAVIHPRSKNIKLDLRREFWQIPIKQIDTCKTAFTPVPGFGTYEFTSEHLSHLDIVFNKLKNARLKFSFDKSDFECRSVTYLEHVITKDIVGPDPAKVEFFKKWETKYHEKITIIPWMGLKNILKTDASSKALGATLVLIKNGKEITIGLARRKPSSAEENYAVVDREILGIIFEFVSNCDKCQKFKPQQTRYRKSLKPKDPTFEPLHIWHTDYVGPVPTTKSGYRYILLFVDRFSKWTEAFATQDATSETTANLLTNEIIPRFGIPDGELPKRGQQRVTNRTMRPPKEASKASKRNYEHPPRRIESGMLI